MQHKLHNVLLVLQPAMVLLPTWTCNTAFSSHADAIFLPAMPLAACCRLLQLDQISGSPTCIEIQDALNEVTGGRSVPRVFIGGNFIGGGDDTAAKQANGQLAQLLQAVGLP